MHFVFALFVALFCCFFCVLVRSFLFFVFVLLRCLCCVLSLNVDTASRDGVFGGDAPEMRQMGGNGE